MSVVIDYSSPSSTTRDSHCMMSMSAAVVIELPKVHFLVIYLLVKAINSYIHTSKKAIAWILKYDCLTDTVYYFIRR